VQRAATALTSDVVVHERHLVRLAQAALDLPQLEADDLLQVLVAHRVVRDEHHAPEERRLEDLVQLGFSAFTIPSGSGAVSGSPVSAMIVSVPAFVVEQDDRVLEVDLPPLAVVHHALVEHLEEQLQHVGVRLLDLVEQHHRVRTPAHGLGEHAALAVARRSPAASP
jgi:hypothetical protein